MKKLDRFILKAFIGPFFGILAVVVFIFIMQFLWLYIDELVGKGLGLKVVMEFLLWGSATMLPICLPLATLLASVMTVGQMAENNELIAMKSAGLSLDRIFRPLMISAVIISIGAFFTANNLVPVAFNKIYTLRDDFGNTKEEINIPTGTFYSGIDGYVLRIQDRDSKTKMMKDVMVYDHTDNQGNTSLTLADSAMMKMSKEKDYLTFKLYNGVNYKETNEMHYRDTSLQIQKIEFASQEILIPLKDYAFKKSNETRYGDQIKSMDVRRLMHGKDSLNWERDSTKAIQMKEMNTNNILQYYSKQIDTAAHFVPHSMMEYNDFRDWSTLDIEKYRIESALRACDNMNMFVNSYAMDSYHYVYLLRRSTVELLKKFAQAILCLILFFIGAPLGSFVKRGGLGISAIIGVMFFVLYWVVDITGTKLANDGAVLPAIGVFVSTAVMLPIGLFLTYKAINDATLFNTDSIKIWWRKKITKFMGIFKKTRIVYMGTPEFAVAPLDALIQAKYNVVGVVTVADKPSGRGLKVNQSAVKKYAVEHNLPVLQPVKLKDPEFLKELASWKADLFVVVAFRMLPEEVWKMPSLGTFNLHAALLPQYRGAAPINWAVINGEKMSGVTTFMIDKDIDTGGIMLRQSVKIAENDTAGDLHDKLMPIGADLVLQTVEGIIEKNIETRVQRSFIQGSEVLKPAPKLNKELCHIDWNDTTRHIYNLIRGLSPYPTAFTELVKEEIKTSLKIYSAEEAEKPAGAQPGTLFSDGKTFLKIATEDGAISIKELQLSGKKRMDVKSFLLGFRDIEDYTTSEGTSKAEINKTKA